MGFIHNHQLEVQRIEFLSSGLVVHGLIRRDRPIALSSSLRCRHKAHTSANPLALFLPCSSSTVRSGRKRLTAATAWFANSNTASAQTSVRMERTDIANKDQDLAACTFSSLDEWYQMRTDVAISISRNEESSQDRSLTAARWRTDAYPRLAIVQRIQACINCVLLIWPESHAI